MEFPSQCMQKVWSPVETLLGCSVYKEGACFPHDFVLKNHPSVNKIVTSRQGVVLGHLVSSQRPFLVASQQENQPL